MHTHMHICNVEFLDLVKESLLAEKKFAGKPILMNTFHINKLLGIEENGPCLQIFTTVRVHHCTCFSIANNKIEWLQYTLEGYIVLCSKWQGL